MRLERAEIERDVGLRRWEDAVKATADLLEVSTPEVEDVVRLKDRYGRR